MATNSTIQGVRHHSRESRYVILAILLFMGGVIFLLQDFSPIRWTWLLIIYFGGGSIVGSLSIRASQKTSVPWSISFALAASLLAVIGATIFLHADKESSAAWQLGTPLRLWELNYSTTILSQVELPAVHFDINIDKLASFFILVVFGIASCVSLYSLGYLQDEDDSTRPGFIAASFNLFLLMMFLVVISDNIFWFILLWGGLTLVSSFLVLYKHNKLLSSLKQTPFRAYAQKGRFSTGWERELEESKVAVILYLIASHASSLFIAVSLILLTTTALTIGGMDGHSISKDKVFSLNELGDEFLSFENIESQDGEIEAVKQQRTLLTRVFILAFIGFAIKAGAVPFHIWLPYAHPASPANAHALMSGTMIKLSIYGLIRLFVDVVPPQQSWGVVVLVSGALTAIVGVLYAIVNQDLKKALAYHSIENLGIIMVGLGTAMMAAASDWSSLATLGLAASLLHVLNHAVFKSLLFTGTGAVERLTGSTHLSDLGGLLQDAKPFRVRILAWTFLIGSVAIAGFPPLNGFVSEYLTVQSLLAHLSLVASLSLKNAQILLLLDDLLIVLLLTVSFSLTIYCFVKIVGEAILGRGPRNQQLRTSRVSGTMLGALIVLAVLCFSLGVFHFGIDAARFTVEDLISADMAEHALEQAPDSNWPHWTVDIEGQMANSEARSSSPPQFSYATVSFMGLGVALVIMMVVGYLAGRQLWGRPDVVPEEGKEKYYQRWLYGESEERVLARATKPQLQFTTLAFTYLVRDLFGGFYRDRRKLPVKVKEYLHYEIYLSADDSEGKKVIELFNYFYSLVVAQLDKWSNVIGNRLQNGDLREYVTYLILVYVLVIVVSGLW